VTKNEISVLRMPKNYLI